MGEVVNASLENRVRPEAVDALVNVQSLYALIRRQKAAQKPIVEADAESIVQKTLFTVSDNLSADESEQAWSLVEDGELPVSAPVFALNLRIKAEDRARREQDLAIKGGAMVEELKGKYLEDNQPGMDSSEDGLISQSAHRAQKGQFYKSRRFLGTPWMPEVGEHEPQQIEGEQ